MLSRHEFKKLQKKLKAATTEDERQAVLKKYQEDLLVPLAQIDFYLSPVGVRVNASRNEAFLDDLAKANEPYSNAITRLLNEYARTISEHFGKDIERLTKEYHVE